MIDATTMMQLFTGMSMFGSAISGYGQYTSGKAQRAAYEYNASAVLEQAEEERAASEAKYAALKGRQRSLYAKAGVDISSGSPLVILADTAYQMAEEQERIGEAGRRKAGLMQYYGDVAEWTGELSGLETFLTGVGRAGGQYLAYQKGQAGVPTINVAAGYGPGA